MLAAPRGEPGRAALGWPDDRGFVHVRAARERLRYARWRPAPELAPFVAHYWIVEYDLRGESPYRQRILPHPSVNLVVTDGRARPTAAGPTRSWIAGVIRGHYDETLRDTGWVVGARFRPGGFRPFLGMPVATITDRFLPLTEVFAAGEAAVRQLTIDLGHTPGDDADDTGSGRQALLNQLDALLLAAGPVIDPTAAEVDGVVARIAVDPAIARVDELARQAGTTPRQLQRLFAEYVGASPKWVIRLYRLHEAADRAASGEKVSWAALAAELGYSDQAHLVRDFTAQVGAPPARYARQGAAGTPRPPRDVP
ncbi:helix-turn-helix domain-containing protein [Micromonospora polyrhachis]|uniref:AraC-like DNA-binding protein n=2 Tax=Micromonospora polyrhachis TaxID=1282883 RepID=A0A7W7SM59_9ACTN|nr:AraC-like DNA-binding protein [Micromonospora polyrhachis]